MVSMRLHNAAVRLLCQQGGGRHRGGDSLRSGACAEREFL